MTAAQYPERRKFGVGRFVEIRQRDGLFEVIARTSAGPAQRVFSGADEQRARRRFETTCTALEEAIAAQGLRRARHRGIAQHGGNVPGGPIGRLLADPEAS